MTPTPLRSRAGHDLAKRARLRSARLLALGLLLAAGALYIVATHFESRDPALGFLAAFSQAAMVGALADWFAVVALFRRPFGIPLPHTAIISANKTRIADNLGEFIQSRFLSTDKVVEGIRTFAPGRRLARWCARTENVARVQGHLQAILLYVLQALTDSGGSPLLKEALLSQLDCVDAAALTAQILRALAENRRHQWLLDEALTQLNEFLQHDDVRAELVRTIARHIEFIPSALHLDERVGRALLQRLYEALQTVLADVRADSDHVLRRRFDEVVFNISTKLMTDDVLRERLKTIQHELLGHPETQTLLSELGCVLRDSLHEQLTDPHAPLTRHLHEGLARLMGALAERADIHAWIDTQLITEAPPLIDKYRRTLGLFIAAQVRAWNDTFLVEQIELNIGRDLQFIRINGTLVGGLVGLLIYALSQFLH